MTWLMELPGQLIAGIVALVGFAGWLKVRSMRDRSEGKAAARIEQAEAELAARRRMDEVQPTRDVADAIKRLDGGSA